MKTGKSLVELAQELVKIKTNGRDFIVPNDHMKAIVEDDKVKLSFDSHKYAINKWSGSQLSSFAEIPKPYFDRLQAENPMLLASNINHGFERKADESRLVRTYNGNVRGLLSSRYRILDAHDMLEAVLPLFQQYGMEVVSSEITEQRLFIKALTPKLMADIKKGDTVQHGLVVSTSDVGSGSVRVEPLLYRLVCTNGLISNTAIRKYHVGKNQHEDSIQELLSDKTKAISDAAFWMQVRDIVTASLKPENFEREINKLRATVDRKIDNFDLPKVVELSMKATGITGETKKNSILAALASGNQGAGLTQYGLINAFTAAAKDDRFSYEEAIELERAGGEIVELKRDQWKTIAEMAA